MRNLVLVKPLPTLKCSTQVNIFNVYVVETIVATINAGEIRFSKSRVHVQEGAVEKTIGL